MLHHCLQLELASSSSGSATMLKECQCAAMHGCTDDSVSETRHEPWATMWNHHECQTSACTSGDAMLSICHSEHASSDCCTRFDTRISGPHHSSIPSVVEFCSHSTQTSLQSSWMRLKGKGFVGKSVRFRSVPIFTILMQASSWAISMSLSPR